MPVFCVLDRQISTFRRASYFRDYRNIDAVDWISVCNESNDIHEEATNCISKRPIEFRCPLMCPLRTDLIWLAVA